MHYLHELTAGRMRARDFLAAVLVAVVAILPIRNADAFWHGSLTGPTGISQLGINSVATQFTNQLKNCPFNTTSAQAVSFDQSGYPNGVLGSNVSCSFTANTPGVQYSIVWDAAGADINVTLSIAVSGITVVTKSASATVTGASGNPTITGNGTQAGFVTFTFNSPSTIVGAAFVVNAATYNSNGAAHNWVFCRANSNGGPPNDDCSLFAAGQYFTPEYLTLVKGLDLGWIRLMGWVQTGASLVQYSTNWNYRPLPSNLGWGTTLFIPGARSGGATNASPTFTQSISSTAGTTPIIYTGSPSDDENNSANGQSLGAWASGEVIHGTLGASSSGLTVSGAVGDGTTNCSGGPCVQLTVNSTTNLSVNNLVWIEFIQGTVEANGKHTITAVGSGTITINVPFVHAFVSSTGCVGIQSMIVTGKAGGAAKFIANQLGYPFGGNCGSTSVSTAFAQFVYDPVSDNVVQTTAFTSIIPYEVQIALANSLNVNAWLTIPFFATNNWISSLGTLVATTLHTQLAVGTEYANELWNSTYVQTQQQQIDALFLNFTSAFSYQGLRTRQIGDLFGGAWTAAGRSLSQYEVMLMGQFVNPQGNVATAWAGTELNPTNNQALCLYLGGTFSGTCSGATNYSVSPNRPTDFLNLTTGGAPYAGGSNLNKGPDANQGAAISAANVPFYQSVVNNWVTNGPTGKAAAIALIDDDIRQGRQLVQTVTCSGTTFTTPSAHGFVGSGFATYVQFQVTGGTMYSGIAQTAVYQVTSTPLSTTFTIQPFVNGSPSGTNVNCGSAGTGTVTVGKICNSCQYVMDIGPNLGYPLWQSLVSAITRPGGFNPIKIRWYEGAIEAVGYAAADYTSVGVAPATVTPTGTTHGTTTVDGISNMSGIYVGEVVSAADITASQTVTAINVAGSSVTLSAVASGSNSGETITFTGNGTAAANAVNDAITGWLNDPSSAATIVHYYKGFTGTDPTQAGFGTFPNDISSSNLILAGSPWWLTPSVLSTPFQIYNGIACYNAGTC